MNGQSHVLKRSRREGVCFSIHNSKNDDNLMHAMLYLSWLLGKDERARYIQRRSSPGCDCLEVPAAFVVEAISVQSAVATVFITHALTTKS